MTSLFFLLSIISRCYCGRSNGLSSGRPFRQRLKTARSVHTVFSDFSWTGLNL